MTDPFINTNIDTKHDITCIIVLTVAIVGVIGNGFTLAAFQYARVKRKHHFHSSWNIITVFIFNLSLVDFLSSLNMTILYVQFVFWPEVINDKFVCVTQVTVRDILVLINGASVACIAVVRMMGITKSTPWENFCDRTFNITVVIIITWIVGFVFYIGKLMKVAELLTNQEFEKDTFDCGLFFYKLNLSPVTLYSEFIAHGVIFLIIIVSHTIISIYTRRTSSSAIRLNTTQQDMKTTGLIFLVCVVYVFQCIPYMICRLWFEDSMRKGFFIQFPLEAKVCYVIYYTQFCVNIFIYILRRNDYRGAYVDLSKSIVSKFHFTSNCTNNSPNNSPNEEYELHEINA